MDDQQHHRESVAKDWADLQMPETAHELLLQSQALEQGLKQDQAREGGQALVFETNFWDTMGLAMNAGFATLHANGLRWFIGLVWCLQFYQFRDRFFIAASHLFLSFFGIFWIALGVNSSRKGGMGI
jgi:hypothetical protein